MSTTGRYVPRKTNASLVDVLPEEYRDYAAPKEGPDNAARKAAEVKAAEEAARVKPQRAVKQGRTQGRVRVAPNQVKRTERLEGTFKLLQSDIPPKGLTRVAKQRLDALKDTFQTRIDAPIKQGEELVPNPLGVYAKEQKEAEENPRQYKLDTSIYMPSTRTGFYKFIGETYAKRFTIGSAPRNLDPNACEKLLQDTGEQGVTAFIYQEFIKEYLRQSSPYRGLLVYHGLGSGKTCSAIAAAESLYGIANKKIIVMTPQSLRNNFIKEISFCGFRHYSLNNHWTRHNLLSIPQTSEMLDRLQLGDRSKFLIRNYLLILYGLSVLSLRYEYIDKLIDRAVKGYNEAIEKDYEAFKNGTKTFDTIAANNNAFLWIPDFRADKKSNFNELSPVDKDMIRFQIAETVRNRFEFISYNGITNESLMEYACKKPDMFDNAIIVIDEIHNLIRLMQGDIEPFLFDRGSQKRSIPAEPVGVERWAPRLCNYRPPPTYTGKPKPAPKYSRGYLFYRLLCGAKNSKIIGLSGTPIINVPEEIGIMANVMAGYIHTVTININAGNSELLNILEEMANKDPRVDYVRKIEGTGFNSVMISIFNEGYMKVFKDDGITFRGVVHSNDVAAQAGIVEVQTRLSNAFLKQERVLRILQDIGKTTKTILTPPGVPKAYPRLPPDMDSFRANFIDVESLGIKKENEIVLKKRLTGIVSYYRRTRPEFFPTIGDNLIVQCELSDHALGVYSVLREKEIKAEDLNKDKDPVGELYSVVEKFSKGKSPSSYRFASRAACNYAFPGKISETLVITRPYPSDAREYGKEVATIPFSISEIPTEQPEDNSQDPELSPKEREDLRLYLGQSNLSKVPTTYNELDEDTKGAVRGWRDTAAYEEQRRLEIEQAMVDAAAASGAVSTEEGEVPPLTGDAEQEGGQPTSKVKPPKPSIPYQALLANAMKQLYDNRATLFNLADEATGLKKYSCKLFKILKKMEVSKGPVLMYSQYKTVEGLGVFAIALKANGYDQIKFKSNLQPWKPIEFDEDSIRSIKKGPSFQKRFIIFSGEEDQRQRSAILAIFNGQWAQLTRSILTLFTESGFQTNPDKGVKYVTGEIIRCIGITGAGAEGISLRNVRQVHIMEPFWNMARLEQVKGRAIRVCSHADLEMKDRVVDIYTYVSVFSESQLDAPNKISHDIKTKDGDRTSDEVVFLVASRKQAISDKLLRVLQEVSVDCGMNYTDNYTVDQEPLECFDYSVSDQTKDPYMFEPDLKMDIISTRSKVGQTTTTNKTHMTKFLTFYHNKKRYIVGPWVNNEYAYIYDSKKTNISTPVSAWTKAGRVEYDPITDDHIGSATVWGEGPPPEIGEGDEEEGDEEEDEENENEEENEEENENENENEEDQSGTEEAGQ